ncbi:MAG TPA: serine/threonine-protein kinase [Planctomycetota bacterium]|nr:serine/threonine-protein kinase [Planctomycetota bacterium]
MAQPATNNPPAAEHNSFGKVAIKLGYITEGQLEEAMKVQATAAKAGLRKRLGEILIKKGYLTPEQFQEVLKSQTVKSKRIGAYELISKLGEGGMGSVFKARQVFMDRVIALKILSPKMAKNKDFRERFVREARAVAKLNHPNIVAGIDVGSADGYCYFAMEFVDGESLGQYMQRKGGKLDETICLEFTRQAAMALHHAHQNNLLHRDVKPDNLLLDKERNIVKLADLGLARSAESAEDDAALTQAGQAVGTPFYISPEQARGLSDLTPATDIYSLGASIFHLLTGQVPFDGPTAAVIMTRHLTDPVPSMRKLNPKVSEAVEKIVFKCMEKKPEDRYADALELVAAIEKVQGGGVGASSTRKPKGSARGVDVVKEKDRDRNERAEKDKDKDRDRERDKEREREREKERERERERAKEKQKVLITRPRDDDDDAEEDDDEPVERDKRSTTNVGSTASVSATRSFRRRKTGGDVGGFLFVVLILIGGAGALYYFKPELFRGKPPATNSNPNPNPNPSPNPNPGGVQQPVSLRAAVPAKIVKAADGSFSYKIDFENDFSAFDVDPALAKAGEEIMPIIDGAKNNHVLRLAKIRPLGEPAAGSMVRLSLPPDLQVSGKAVLKFKICVFKTADPDPEIHVHWDHLREGAGARALAIWSLKTQARDAWTEMTLLLEKAPMSVRSRVTPDKPQYISIYGAKPDENAQVFIDELELSDAPSAAKPSAQTQEAPIAPPPSKKEQPIAPAPAKKEPPVAPPPSAPKKQDDPADALNRAL